MSSAESRRHRPAEVRAWHGRLMAGLAGFARKRALVALTLATLALGARAALLSWVPLPKPGIQDEFSYLLAGDTFASGRLTNPRHPMWIHFETVHVMVRPTYQSKYPPLQGLILAFGQTVFQQPWAGVWLSVGAMCAALWWALAGWFPPRWALLGATLAVLKIGIVSYWSESYWGGAAAAAAGALVIGAVPRLRSAQAAVRRTQQRTNSADLAAGGHSVVRRFLLGQPESRNSAIMAFGLALLAVSRPYEGLVLGTACLVAVLVKAPLRSIALPMAAVLLPAALWIGYYNYRVTGNPLLMPYRAHERQYATWSPLIWDTHPRPAPHYNHEALRATWVDWEEGQRRMERERPLLTRLGNFLTLENFYLGTPLTLCAILLGVPAVLRDRRILPAVILLGVFVFGLEMETALWPHYAAPGTALIFILATGALRALRRIWVPGLCLVLPLVLVADIIGVASPASRWLFDKRDFIARRDAILSRLQQAPGKQLVLTGYGPHHNINHEWVYNRADIDGSRIIWARFMGSEKDRELLNYYSDRQVWKLFEDGDAGLDLSVIRLPGGR